MAYFITCVFFLQVNRIKIPKQIDEFVEMQTESGNLLSKVIFRVKSELHGVSFRELLSKL